MTVGIPALVLITLITVRVLYYLFWRKHWDKRPAKAGDKQDVEIVVIPPHSPPDNR